MRSIFLALVACMAAAPALSFPVQRCVNLSNHLEAPPGEDWGYRYRPVHLKAIAEAGFDTLRLPARVSAYWDGTAIDPRFLAELEALVNAARREGLFVILDLHHFLELVDDPEGQADTFVEIWAALAEHFGGQDRIAFELLNEPNGAATNKVMEPLYARALAEIRAHDTNIWVIWGGGDWNAIGQLSGLAKPEDPRVVHTFHYYGPFEFTHQLAPWHEEPMPAANWGTAEDRKAVGDAMARAAAHHTPVFLGEFGTINKAAPKDRVAWIETARKAAEANGIPWCHWGFGAGFGAYDPRTGQWVEPVRAALLD